MEPALRIRNLEKTFKTGFIPKKKKILKGISLEVKEGEVFGYLGPNGAGKTTTLKCILGLIFPDQGEISIFGKHHLSQEAKQKIGFLPESPYFYDYLTAFEFMELSSQLFLMDKKEREERINLLLRKVGLEKAENLQLRKFSRGMLQRLGLAQALVNNPSLLFLDEPLGGLDPLGRKEIRDIILNLKGEGKTVFLCSHILQDIEMVCDRVAIIVSGKILNEGSLQELISEKILFTELIISGVEEKELQNFGECLVVQSGKIFIKVFDENKLGEIIRLVDSRKGKIHSLIPRTETLEDIFVEMVTRR